MDHVERLIQDALSASGSKRLQAIEALGHSGDLRALQPLLDLLHDVDPSIREQASKALRTLVQSLRQVYTHLAQWLDRLLLRLDIYLAPDPPIEQTKAQPTI
jgi:HEAT repeat protein